MIQWIGAICVVGACGACGFSMAASYTGLQRNLRQLYNGLELMQCQMEYQMTELPELCGILASACTGPVGKFFGALGREMQNGETAEASACVAMTLARDRELPEACRSILSQLGKTLGQLDLSGQPGAGVRPGDLPEGAGGGGGGKGGPTSLLPGPGIMRRGRSGHSPAVSLWKWI